MLDGVQSGAGNTRGIGQLLLQDAQLATASSELRADSQQLRVIACWFSLLVSWLMRIRH